MFEMLPESSSMMALLILILVSGLYMAWNIGANDVANAMGTSVGSGALSLRQAVLIAAVLEFSGAFFFGSHVSKTMEEGIVNSSIFTEQPLLLVFGMLASLLGAGVWLQIASYFGWPVSTTHSIVGAIVGFGAAIGGLEAIYWGNVAYIACSWLLSPLVGGILAFLIFNLLRNKILYAPNPLAATKKLAPVFLFIIAFALALGFIFEERSQLSWFSTFWRSIGISLAVGLGSALLGIVYLRKYHPLREMETIHSDYVEVEKIFGKLQLISACLMAFAHGANDVANAIGPLAAAVNVLITGSLAPQESVPTWALALGGIGIVLGLATWGWRVIETIGKKLTELTPTRGFAAEFSAALTILVASRLGMPISATHTLVGAVLGVGFARGLEALNLGMMRDILVSWIVTIPLGATLSIAFFYIIQSIFG